MRRKDGSSLPAEICAKTFPDGRWQACVETPFPEFSGERTGAAPGKEVGDGRT